MARKRTDAFIERLEQRHLLAVVINEVLARNADGITDQDGDRSDWLELRNTGASPVDVGGWHLTDDSLNLIKWQFPSPTMIPAGGYLTVFASDKNRAIAGQELHTNFKLTGAGEYLGLVQSDGTTIESALDPFPPQKDDKSYGIAAGPATSAVTLIGDGTLSKVLSPSFASAAVDDFWREISFDDSTWSSKITGVGFDRDLAPNNALDPYIGNGTGSVGTGVGDELTTTQMPNTRLTAYIRVPFTVTDAAQLTSLQLQLRYDDGFIMYLNGVEVLRENADNTIKPVWNQNARANRPDSEVIVPTTHDLTRYLPELVEGTNVLAIHGMNHSSQNTDFLIDPILTAQRATGTVTGYMATPTPGMNNGAGTLGFVADTEFSVDRGFYDSPFQVAITTATPSASIRYTLDGSLPSQSNGTLYAGPINVTTTTTLRAIACLSGWTSSNVDTQTYLFLNDVIQQTGSGVPGGLATWGHAGPDWSMDPDVVTDPTYAATIVDDLKAIPTMSVVMNWGDLFGVAPQGIYSETIPWKSSAVERAMSVEYFNASGTQEFRIDGAIEVQGGSSDTRWNSDKLSLQLKFKKAFGPADLEYAVFAGAPYADGATSEFDTLLLDAQFNYTWVHGNAVQHSVARYVQDQVVSDYQNLVGGTAPHGRWVHLYLNGKYWGIYNLHEKVGDSFAAEYFGGEKEDYDVIKHSATNWSDGGLTAVNNYAALLNATRADMTTLSNYQAVEALLDVDDFIDYMIVHYYSGNWDWGGDNWYATHNRAVPGAKWRFHAWDQEHAFQTDDNAAIESPDHNQNEDLTTKNDIGGPTEIHNNLMDSPEYKLRFADGVQAHLANGGQLTPAAAAAVYQARAAEIDRAIVGESARWGDNRAAVAYTRANFIATTNGVLADFFPVRTNVVLGQFTTRGWLMSLAAPQFSSYGGEVSPGTQLTMSKPGGSPAGATIYYTLDGSDPRLVGGALSGSAIPYSGAITLNSNTRVLARIRDGANWSALIDAAFIVTGSYPLRITEVHYHPANHPSVVDDEDLEFIELLNVGTQPVNLSGVQITQFVSPAYVFGNIVLAAGERIVVARDPAVFESVYGTGINVAPIGYTPGNLSNGGELIALIGPLGETLVSFTYDDIAPWPTTPDGGGPSLEIIDPLGDPIDPANWRASAQIGGSPGGIGDTTPPTVLSAFYDISSGAILIEFSEPIAAASLQAADLVLEPLLPAGDDLTPAGVSYDAPTNTATFTFASPLASGHYLARLAAGVVTDTGANALADDFEHHFIYVAGAQSLALPPGAIKINQLAIAAGGQLDLGTSRLVVDYSATSPIGSWTGSSYSGITGLVQSGYNGGGWDGGGIVTSMSNSGAGLRALGVEEASKALDITGTDTELWNGLTVDATSVIVKYTYMGDIDLDGDIDGDDYFWIDSNIAQSGLVFGYGVGDIDLDGDIDGDDYFWIDSNISGQGPPL